MMKKRIAGVLLASIGVIVSGLQAFADNSYNIEYSGGVDLSAQNVVIDSTLIDGLTRLIEPESMVVTYSNASKWKSGYMKLSNNACYKTKYFMVWDDSISSNDGLSYTIAGDRYKVDVNIDKVVLDGITGLSEGRESLAVLVREGAGSIDVGREVYTDSICTSKVSSIRSIKLVEEGKLFVQTGIKLYKKDSVVPVRSDQLYTLIADIDGAQSFKILNSDSLLKVGNMYALSVAGLQPSGTTTLRNKFVSNGNYIYSEYNDNGFDITDTSNINVKLGQNTQEEGLKLVFGYAGMAGSEIAFYGKQYTVYYESDENGKVVGIDTEKVLSGENPTGSSTEPNDGYVFDYWVADVDVTLGDGVVVKAGGMLTSEQVKLVEIERDTTFTGIHKGEDSDESDDEGVDGIIVPDTGTFTGNSSALLIIVPVWLILMVVLGGRFAYRKATEKRVRFDSDK